VRDCFGASSVRVRGHESGRPRGGRRDEGLRGVCVWVGDVEEEGLGRGGEEREGRDDALSIRYEKECVRGSERRLIKVA